MSFLQNHPKIVSQPANTLGRDFIVGDLHGCRSLLEDLLAEVAFDGARDRLFSVGDLVDRGPDSEGCLELLKEPWFYPVLGTTTPCSSPGYTVDVVVRDAGCTSGPSFTTKVGNGPTGFLVPASFCLYWRLCRWCG